MMETIRSLKEVHLMVTDVYPARPKLDENSGNE
jgi:hypothetical protein